MIVSTAAANAARGFAGERVESFRGRVESSSSIASSLEGAATEAREGAAAAEVAAEVALEGAVSAAPKFCADSTTLLTKLLPSTPRRRTSLCAASNSTLDPSLMNE